MDRDNDVENFWNCVERKMAIIFPRYLRNILKFLGYDNATTVRAISQEDIDEKLESFAKTSMMSYIPSASKSEDYFSYFGKPESFHIPPGHKILLRSVVEYIRQKTDIYGIDFFNFYQPFDDVKSTRKRTQKSSKFVTAPPAIENVVNMSLLSEPQCDQINDERANDANDERANLFAKINAWLEKYKKSYPSIKYLHNVNLDSIVMGKEVDEFNVEKTVAMLPCPICGDKKRVPQVLSEKNTLCMSISNYTRHVRSHKKDNEPPKEKVSSKRRPQESEPTNSRKKRRVNTDGIDEKGGAFDSDTMMSSSASDVSPNRSGKQVRRFVNPSSSDSEDSANEKGKSDSIGHCQSVSKIAIINKERCESKDASEKQDENRTPDALKHNVPSISSSDSESDSQEQDRMQLASTEGTENNYSQKWKSLRSICSSSDSDTSVRRKNNLKNTVNKDLRSNSSSSSSEDDVINEEKACPKNETIDEKKKQYRKRSNMRSNFLKNGAQESKDKETLQSISKPKARKTNLSKKPFNRFV